MKWYRLFGLHILSPLGLGGDELTREPGDFITLSIEPAAAFEPAPATARVLSHYEFPNGAAYSHVQTESGYISNYFDKVQFRLTPDRKSISARPAPCIEPEWIKVLMAASYPAFLMFLTGRAPLHASAVWLSEWSGAVGVLGGPGRGKSTLAGALCLAGGTLISDDLMSFAGHADRVIPAPRRGSAQSPAETHGFLCQPGSRQLRLRLPSAELKARFGARRVSASPDGRCLVDAREALPEVLPLKALFEPVLSRQATEVRLAKLTGYEAFQAVACDPRIKGLVEPTWIRNAFEHAAGLARKVPVYRATVPFAERNFGDIGRQLSAAFRDL